MARVQLFIVLCVIIAALANAKIVDFKYKEDAVLDCSELGNNVTFYAKTNETEEALKAGDRVLIEGGKLTLKNLRNPEIDNIDYSCKNGEKSIQFKKRSNFNLTIYSSFIHVLFFIIKSLSLSFFTLFYFFFI